jgi:DNA-binding response OmpR family regulator
MNILVVDTDNETIEDVNFTLNKWQPDWHVSIVDSGGKCIDRINNGNSPDVIILGMQLIDIPDFELIGRIRENSDVPVIVLSHDKDIQTLVKAFDAGVNDYIVKPFNKAIFVARLKALLRRRIWDIRAKEKVQGAENLKIV